MAKGVFVSAQRLEGAGGTRPAAKQATGSTSLKMTDTIFGRTVCGSMNAQTRSLRRLMA